MLALLVAQAAVICVVDPYFHYHKPLKGLYYTLDNERSQNDGIIRHFNYDAMIIGTSMAENFKTSEMDELWMTRTESEMTWALTRIIYTITIHLMM